MRKVQLVVTAVAVAWWAAVAATAEAPQGIDWFPYIGLKTDATMRVVQVEPNSPAQKGNLTVGDKIDSINGVPTGSVSHTQSVASMRGDLGTDVELVILRGSKNYVVNLNRASDWRRSNPQSAAPQQPSEWQALNSHAEEQDLSSEGEDIDKRLVVLAERAPDIDQVYRQALRGVAFLSPSMKQFFVTNGVTVVVTTTLAALGLPPGRSEYDARGKRAVICQTDTDGTKADLTRLHINTLHELGHAYDQLLGYPSRQAPFLESYGDEAPRVPEEYKPQLEYFLQPGPNGPRECFASLFACRYYKGDDRRLTQLKAAFPKTFALVNGLKE